MNFTLRPYYAEGSKTVLFECAEQLGWTLPHHIVVPVGSGALLTRQATAAKQLRATRLVPESHFHIHAAQPAGCAPVSDAVLDNWRPVEPVRKPQTLAKSLAIGAPADGDGSVKSIRDTRAARLGDHDEIRAEAPCRYARVFLEPAGGVVCRASKQLASRGVFIPATVSSISPHRLQRRAGGDIALVRHRTDATVPSRVEGVLE